MDTPPKTFSSTPGPYRRRTPATRTPLSPRVSFVIKLQAAAVDGDVGGVDEPRFIARQEERGVGHLARRANALARNQLGLAAAGRFRIGLSREPRFSLRRQNQARRYRVDADAARRVFDRECTCETDQAVFGDWVGEAAGNDLVAMNRGNIHDAAGALRQHGG